MPNLLLTDLRNKYPEFVYQDFSYKKVGSDLRLVFDFFIRPDIYFKPQIIIKNIKFSQLNSLNKQTLDNFVFHLGLIEMLSYWKVTCSPIIRIGAGSLSLAQIDRWKDLFIKGMGQFFYTNKIDFTSPDFLEIIADKNKKFPISKKKVNQKNLLALVGGGKDSAVMLELLKKTKKEIFCFAVNPNKAIRQVIKLSGVKNEVIVERRIDQKLLELNKKGFLNGHTPFSALLAFLSAFCGLLFDCGQIVVAQERSSNEGNVNYLGYEVNHQYSKSFEFENKFRSYLNKYLIANLNYFSFLRPLYELQIGKIFSSYPQYFSIFKSCNVGQKTNTWCTQCPKCLFVFIALYPFLKYEDLVEIFGQDLFKKRSLLPVLKGLIGLKECKPFECVGTREETLVALKLCYKKAEEKEAELPCLLQFFKKQITITKPRSWMSYSKIRSVEGNILKGWNKDNNLPLDFKKILKKELND